MTFEELNLHPQILQALRAKGYVNPTPIQEKAIPHILEGKDIFGTAQTGTGKTAAFALPVLQRLYDTRNPQQRRAIRALVLAPTRELAQQISDSFREYGKGLHLKHTVIYGGVSQRPQTEALRSGVDILIATPGRLIDLMDQGYVRLEGVEYFILDEVDRMLDMGFIHDIKKVIATIRQKKQTLFFSATVPTEIKKLADSLMKDPVRVQTAPVSSTSVNVKQQVYFVPKEHKTALLKELLLTVPDHHTLVFVRTKRAADKMVKILSRDGLEADCIHGDKSQGARQRALNNFKSRKVNLLIATDVASRGLDITDISHVFNYDLPEEAEVYVHRIGRTGRANAVGLAVSFCSPDERGQWKDINRLTGNKIEVCSTPSLPKQAPPPSNNGPSDSSEGRHYRQDSGRSHFRRDERRSGSFRQDDRGQNRDRDRDHNRTNQPASTNRSESSGGQGQRESGHSSGGKRKWKKHWGRKKNSGWNQR